MPSKKSKSLKRRTFIKNGIAASSLFIVPRHVLGGVGYTAPSDQLALAGIGVGGKGQSDLRNASVKGRERAVRYVILIILVVIVLRKVLIVFQMLNFMIISKKC
jgi:hypothetical protein